MEWIVIGLHRGIFSFAKIGAVVRPIGIRPILIVARSGRSDERVAARSDHAWRWQIVVAMKLRAACMIRFNRRLVESREVADLADIAIVQNRPIMDSIGI